jgi:hypothetical protein
MTELTGTSALDRLGEQFERLEADPPPRRPSGHALMLAAAIVAVLVAASLSPPGRAVADKLGELVGIGDEATDVGGDSVVIGVGEGPSGARYEVFSFKDHPNVLGAEICFGIAVPPAKEADTAADGAICLTGDEHKRLERDVVAPIAKPAPRALGVEDMILVEGITRGDVATVELELETEGGAAESIPVETLPPEELEPIVGSSEGVGYFYGMVPEVALYGEEGLGDRPIDTIEESFQRLRLRALDAEGAALVDELYPDLPLPGWWPAPLQGPIPKYPPSLAPDGRGAN